MNGIFGDIFDFDGDGRLDIIEQAAELAFIFFCSCSRSSEYSCERTQ